jgi:hypothetical protein
MRQAESTTRRRWCLATAAKVIVVVVLATPPAVCQAQRPSADPPKPTPGESTKNWRYRLDVSPPEARTTSRWQDFVLTPTVFEAARLDLADLRLFDAEGHELPYDLRIRRPDYRTETIPGKIFNRSRGTDGSAEVAIDLGSETVEHNEVDVELPLRQYHRQARLEGSVNGLDWRLLVGKNLFHFELGKDRLEDRRLSYSPSRYRYLRVRVEPDRVVDKSPLEITAVKVLRRVEVPGESLTLPGRLGAREPVRTDGVPGSAWTIALGGDHVPCERITCEVDDPEFVRNYRIESGGPPGEDTPFGPVTSGVWRRTAGSDLKPVVAEFPEIQASRLRLVVTDAGNPPLNVRSVTFGASAREVVFPGVDSTTAGSLRLYVGNPKGFAPRYDFARNLPASLEPAPTRRTLSSRLENPDYLPEPKPLTERWPWLIYVVLGVIAATLGLIIVDLARQAIARHDASQPVPSSN